LGCLTRFDLRSILNLRVLQKQEHQQEHVDSSKHSSRGNNGRCCPMPLLGLSEKKPWPLVRWVSGLVATLQGKLRAICPCVPTMAVTVS